MKRFFYYSVIACFILLANQNSLLAQNTKTSILDSFLEKDLIKKADSALNAQVSYFKRNNQIDSLYKYPYYVGKISLLKHNKSTAVKKAEAFIDNLKLKKLSARTIYKSYLNIHDLYIDLEDDANCIITSKKALEYVSKMDDITKAEIGYINYVIGSDYYALYDLSNAIVYFKKSVNAYEKSKTVKKFTLADSYNGVAVSMWTLNKLDSAQVYFNKAIKATEESKLESFDRAYYINAFKFNLALVINDQGKLDESIALKKDIIKNLQNIIDNCKDAFLLKKSKRLQTSSISNLAAFYNDAGFLTKAYNMLQYSYSRKKELYESKSPKLITALNQIALSELNLKEYDKSIKTSNKALIKLKEATSEYFSIEADILHIQAKCYFNKKDTVTATNLYKKSQFLYNKVYPLEYSREYLIFLRDYAFFLASIKNKEDAILIAKKSYKYILKNGGNDNLTLLKELINLSAVYFKCEYYEKAHEWALVSIEHLNKKKEKTSSNLDLHQIEFYTPNVILLECQSKYKLASSKNITFLKSLLERLNKAILLLEKQKTTLFKSEDINILLSDYKSITDFSKQVALDLYEKTNNSKHLENILVQHESSIYNRIRLRLNLKSDIAFKDIPKTLLKKEQDLKKRLSSSLSNLNSINDFFNANTEWDSFLDSIKLRYPKYYKMRYATIEEPLDRLQENISKNTTVIRYLFIDNVLYATVINTKGKNIFKLDSKNIEDDIFQLANHQYESDSTSTKLHKLYSQLWQPFEKEVATDNVIIIPDGVLFNLSFESLTSSKINSFKDLATNSLLSKYTISYNYSLLLLDKDKKTINYQKDFIAFAPEFNDKMKQEYSVAIKDSITIDETYLKLLPQPFSVDLAKEYSKLFNGDYFINEKASKQIFKNEANEHKIIHIGTHAESNNVTPELSRLIFAKNVKDEDNSLYTYEIYNENLNANLAILTACETGKPTYQAGEGMISLAHAFNYAGSESILTSLWKIDEQSSSKIIELFYNNIKKGLLKDKALQQAKLSYIANSEGRIINPHYWAGLVLIGDTQPIILNTSSNMLWYLLGVLLLILGLIYIIKTRKK